MDQKARIQNVVDRIRKHHFRVGAANVDKINRLQVKLGGRLPADFVEFYSEVDGAWLFRGKDPPFRLMSVSEMEKVDEGYFPESEDNERLLVFCYCQDSNYVGVRCFDDEPERVEIVDCWHEAYPEFGSDYTIGTSFIEFVEGLLDSEGREFWLGRKRQ